MTHDKIVVDTGDLRKFLKEELQVTVNGKIDRIAAHLKRQDKQLKKLEEKLDPYFQGFSFLKTLARVMAWGLGGLSSVGAAYLMVKQILKF